MFSTHRKALVMALAGLCMGAVLGLVVDQALAASSRKLTGTVAHVDVRFGLLVLRGTDGTLIKMAAPAMLLKDLRTGEGVEVALTEGSATRLTRAKPGAVSATVQQVDKTAELLRLRTTEGEIIDMQPSPTLLGNLRVGEHVAIAVRKTGGVGERQRVATGERQRVATVAATVENVDQHSKSLTIRTINHEIVELQAPAGLLDRLQAGDRVEVVIRKQDRAE